MLSRWLIVVLEGVVLADASLLDVHLFVVAHLFIGGVELFHQFSVDTDLLLLLFLGLFLHDFQVDPRLHATDVLLVEGFTAIDTVVGVKLIEGVIVDLVAHVHHH